MKESKNTEKILVIDDEQDVRDLVRVLLEHEGYVVFEAEDGASALEELKKEKFDLILLDIMMPGMPPHKILQGIYNDAKNKGTKVTYFSVVDFPGKEKRELLQERNIVGYIQKPFTNKEFVLKIKELLKK